MNHGEGLYDLEKPCPYNEMPGDDDTTRTSDALAYADVDLNDAPLTLIHMTAPDDVNTGGDAQYSFIGEQNQLTPQQSPDDVTVVNEFSADKLPLAHMYSQVSKKGKKANTPANTPTNEQQEKKEEVTTELIDAQYSSVGEQDQLSMQQAADDVTLNDEVAADKPPLEKMYSQVSKSKKISAPADTPASKQSEEMDDSNTEPVNPATSEFADHFGDVNAKSEDNIAEEEYLCEQDMGTVSDSQSAEGMDTE